ncbi:MAG: hypothetical protein KGZ65_05385 [Sphingomonadales bacterium]|nr:hypothetical protein [Sphingomonadales bacterium]
MDGRTPHSNVSSHVNRIPGVRLDDEGYVHIAYGRYHPVTGEGLPIDAPDELMKQIFVALIDDGLDSGIDEDFDLDELIEQSSGGEANGDTNP